VSLASLFYLILPQISTRNRFLSLVISITMVQYVFLSCHWQTFINMRPELQRQHWELGEGEGQIERTFVFIKTPSTMSIDPSKNQEIFGGICCTEDEREQALFLRPKCWPQLRWLAGGEPDHLWRERLALGHETGWVHAGPLQGL
jgi:hypothetical protein